MKIAVLQSSYEGSSSCFKDVDSYDCNPGRLYGPSEHTWKSLFITKAQAVQQVIEASREKYDLYVNLCDGAFDEDRAGVEVIEALESLDLPYTGADAAFYKLPKNKMKYIVQQYGVHTAPFYFASDMEDVTAAAKILRFPLIVKHFNSGGSIGMTRKSKCMNLEELKEQADLFITQFGGVLIEEFIPGRSARLFAPLTAAPLARGLTAAAPQRVHGPRCRGPEQPGEPARVPPRRVQVPEGRGVQALRHQVHGDRLRRQPHLDDGRGRDARQAPHGGRAQGLRRSPQQQLRPLRLPRRLRGQHLLPRDQPELRDFLPDPGVLGQRGHHPLEGWGPPCLHRPHHRDGDALARAEALEVRGPHADAGGPDGHLRLGAHPRRRDSRVQRGPAPARRLQDLRGLEPQPGPQHPAGPDGLPRLAPPRHLGHLRRVERARGEVAVRAEQRGRLQRRLRWVEPHGDPGHPPRPGDRRSLSGPVRAPQRVPRQGALRPGRQSPRRLAGASPLAARDRRPAAQLGHSLAGAAAGLAGRRSFVLWTPALTPLSSPPFCCCFLARPARAPDSRTLPSPARFS